ncbi:MAG: glycosyltransferase family 4 protein [Anaerolineae bacterium]|nr:glycosyltransferase family 4 protein [Anaerolineae bacterium]
MRVAINAWFLDQPGAGSGQYLRGLLGAMADLAPDHQFLLVLPGPAEFEVPGLKAERVTLKSGLWRTNLGKLLFEQAAFPRACRRWRADVAHVPYWGSPLWPGLPAVVTVHDLIPLLLPAYRGGLLVQLYTRLVSASARRATLVLTDSLASKRDIEAHLGLHAGRVRCVYLAQGEQFSAEPSPDDGGVRARYRLPERYVLYLAGHDVRKNVAGLVEAFATVAQADCDAALVIGGRLPDRSDPLFFDPRPLIAALGLNDRVRLIGWVDEADKPALYRGAACAVFASQYEGFGLPVLEALACGAPLVTSNAASLPELAGDAAFALAPDDASGLAGAILACLCDEPLAAELRRRGPQQAARFSWGQTARQTLAAYEEAAPCAS